VVISDPYPQITWHGACAVRFLAFRPNIGWTMYLVIITCSTKTNTWFYGTQLDLVKIEQQKPKFSLKGAWPWSRDRYKFGIPTSTSPKRVLQISKKKAWPCHVTPKIFGYPLISQERVKLRTWKLLIKQQILNVKKLTSLQHRVRATNSQIQNGTNHLLGRVDRTNWLCNQFVLSDRTSKWFVPFWMNWSPLHGVVNR